MKIIRMGEFEVYESLDKACRSFNERIAMETIDIDVKLEISTGFTADRVFSDAALEGIGDSIANMASKAKSNIVTYSKKLVNMLFGWLINFFRGGSSMKEIMRKNYDKAKVYLKKLNQIESDVRSLNQEENISIRDNGTCVIIGLTMLQSIKVVVEDTKNSISNAKNEGSISDAFESFVNTLVKLYSTLGNINVSNAKDLKTSLRVAKWDVSNILNDSRTASSGKITESGVKKSERTEERTGKKKDSVRIVDDNEARTKTIKQDMEDARKEKEAAKSGSTVSEESFKDFTKNVMGKASEKAKNLKSRIGSGDPDASMANTLKQASKDNKKAGDYGYNYNNGNGNSSQNKNGQEAPNNNGAKNSNIFEETPAPEQPNNSKNKKSSPNPKDNKNSQQNQNGQQNTNKGNSQPDDSDKRKERSKPIITKEEWEVIKKKIYLEESLKMVENFKRSYDDKIDETVKYMEEPTVAEMSPNDAFDTLRDQLDTFINFAKSNTWNLEECMKTSEKMRRDMDKALNALDADGTDEVVVKEMMKTVLTLGNSFATLQSGVNSVMKHVKGAMDNVFTDTSKLGAAATRIGK